MKYIIITNSRVENRTNVNLRKYALNTELEKGDIIYFSNKDSIIQTRWEVIGITEKHYKIEKRQHISDCISLREEKFSDKYNKRVNLIAPDDIEYFEKAFNHKIKIYPNYNLRIKNEGLKQTIDEIKLADLKIDLYINIKIKGYKELNIAVIENYGVVTFEYIEDNSQLGTIEIDDICLKRIKNQIQLSEDGENLNINYHKFYACNNISSEILEQLNSSLLEKEIMEQSFIQKEDLREKLENIVKKGKEKIITEEKYFGIKYALMPEYVIVKSIEEKNTQLEEKKITPKEYAELDEEQIRILNEISARTCIEATAGSGKTILLLSKAYSMAKENPDKEFLLLCYNNKLEQDISNQAKYTGKRIKNLKISTLDTFIINENICNSRDYIYNKEAFVKRVQNGTYNKKYGGIFVDEMQQMKDSWKVALYNLLDENKYMVLAGDYYQDIRKKDENEIIEEYEEEKEELIDDISSDEEKYYLENIEFKKIRIDRNYRNTKQITKYINDMIRKIEKYKEEIAFKEKNKYKQPFYGKSKTSGNEPRYEFASNEADELEKIEKEIIRLINKENYLPSDILLLVPMNKNSKSYGKVRMNKLRELIENKMGLKLNDFRAKGSKIDEDGIKLSSIGKAIGLDSKAVILFGTSNIEKIVDNNNNIIFTSIKNLETQRYYIKKEFINNLKDIYVAASRAREELLVIDDIDGKNIITDYMKIE